MLIALDPDERDWEKCATVQLPSGAVRNALNLADNPDNQGKLVSIQGTTGATYCGAYGVKNVIAYKFGDQGIEGSDIPAVTVPVKALYSGLAEDATAIDWTFENVNIPAGLESVWSWTDYNGKHYLNGSAFRYAVDGILSYAVSPEITLPADYTSLAVSFDHAASFQTTLRELCGFSVRIAGSSEWTDLPIPTWPSAGSWTFVNSGNIDISAYAGKTIQVALKYGASTAGADTWEIRNLNITGTN